MTEPESLAEVQYLGNLYPKSNDDQLDYWRLKFLRYPQTEVRRAIVKFYDTDQSGFVDKSGLLAAIESEMGNGPITDPAARAESAKREVAENFQRRIELENQAKISFADIDRILRGISESDLEDLKSGTIQGLPAATAKILQCSDIHTGKALRFHMAKRLKGMAVA